MAAAKVQPGIPELYTIKSGRAEGSGVTPLPHFFSDVAPDVDKDAVATACGVVNSIWCSERINKFQGHMLVELMEVVGITSDRRHWIVRFYSDIGVRKTLLDQIEAELGKMRSDFYQVETCSPQATRVLGAAGRWMSGIQILVPRSTYTQEHAQSQQEAAARAEQEKQNRLQSTILNSGGAFFAPIDKAVSHFSSTSSTAPQSAVSRFSNVDVGSNEYEHMPTLRQPTKMKRYKTPAIFASKDVPISTKRSLLEKIGDLIFMTNADSIQPAKPNE